jgi:hypothetical protein
MYGVLWSFAGIWQSQQMEIDGMKEPEYLKVLAARGNIPGLEVSRWEIVDRRPRRSHPEIAIRNNDQVTTIPWLFPNRDGVIESWTH